MTLSRVLYDLFFQDSTHFSKAEIDSNGSYTYKPQPGIPTLDQIEQHFSKEVVYGAYSTSPGNTVRWIAWDIDSRLGIEKAREIAKKISEFLTANGVPHGIEFSGSKGYHAYVFLTGKSDSKRAKEFGERVRDFFGFAKSGKLHVEVYPKQAELGVNAKGDTELGNLLRLPLGKHPGTGKEAKFVTIDKWEDGPSLDPERIFSERVSLETLEEIVTEIDPTEELVQILSDYWETGQRHDITLRVAGMGAQNGVLKEKMDALITAIHAIVPEGELDDQLNAVESTYHRVAEGKSVLGENGLTDLIPAKVLLKIRKLMGASSASLILQTIDDIRLDKGAPFLKVRYVAQAAVGYFMEHGRLVKDEDNIFWLNHDDHQLTLVNSHNWTRLTHNILGLNSVESFGRQALESIEHKAHESAKNVIARKRSHWDEKTKAWYLNGGGPEVYIADGEVDNLKVVYNGEIDILFRNSEDTMVLPNLLEEDNTLDPWPLLVDDINFKDGDMTVHQQKQLLKAMICAMFFPEAMPTRPIPIFTGVSGSGKTTAARRILWAIEGTKEDVMGQVPDKPDALRASMAAHRMIVLDNIEKTSVSWLPDTLNRAATGSQIELRELHTTNKKQKITFNVFIWMTGTEIPFSDEAVYTRILPFELDYLDVHESEVSIRSKIESNFIPFWRGLLLDMNKIVAELKKHPEMSVSSETRLADFFTFCSRIKGVDFIDADALMEALAVLTDSQKETLKKNSVFIPILEGLIKSRPDEMTESMTTAELFAKAQRYAAQHKGSKFEWNNPQGFSRHLDMLEEKMKKYYGCKISRDRVGGREVKKYKFAVETKAAGAAGTEKVN